MAEHCWTLIDQHANENSDVELSSALCGSSAGRWRVVKRRLHGGLSEGVDLVEIDNGRMKFAVLPTRGMGIWKVWSGGRSLGWDSPVRGPVHPAFVPTSEPAGSGWLSGFDEFMCRCGLESNGAPDFDERGQLRYALHGRIANLPAHRVELVVDDANETIALRGIVEESRFHYHKLRLDTLLTTRFDSMSLEWQDTVENFGGWRTGVQMLYHVNFGAPLLAEGAKLAAPVRQVAPMDPGTPSPSAANWRDYHGPQSGYQQQVYLFDLLGDDSGRTQVLLNDGAGTSAVRMRFNTRELPCFAQWRNLVSAADGYVTGLEPATNFPYPRSQEEKAGRVVFLEPNENWRASVGIDWITEASEVANAEREIADLQGSHEPVVLADFSEFQ
jgi:hypothetical protein